MIARIAKGTASAYDDSSGVSTTTLAGVALGTGSVVVVVCAIGLADVGPQGVTWNGLALTKRVQSSAQDVTTSIWSLDNVTAATGSVVVNTADSLPASVALAVLEVTGASNPSTDKVATGNGVGTSPSSGNTATTSQNNELLVGAVGTFGPISHSAGSWSGSFSDGQRVGTNAVTGLDCTISEGYRIVSATGAYAAAKTGITSAPWGACILTLKEGAQEVTAAGAAGLEVVANERETVAKVLAWEALADQIASGVPVASYDPIALRSILASGVRSFGKAYFAMWMHELAGFVSFGGGEASARMFVSLHEAPQRYASDDEPHWLLSFHEVGGIELFSIGVTPSLRVCVGSAGRPVLYTDPGVILPDGAPREIKLYSPGSGGREIVVNGQRVASDDVQGVEAPGLYSPTDRQCRVMLFNGVEGRTRCACSIHAVEFQTENHNFVWLLNERSGVDAAGVECTGSLDEGVEPVASPDFPDADFTLRADWLDPAPFPLTWPVEGGDVRDAFVWLNRTGYRVATVLRPTYRPAVVPALPVVPEEEP